MDSDVIDFIKQRGPVSQMDLAEHFGIIDDPNIIFPVFRAVRKGIAEGTIARVHAADPINGGLLLIREACSAIA